MENFSFAARDGIASHEIPKCRKHALSKMKLATNLLDEGWNEDRWKSVKARRKELALQLHADHEHSRADRPPIQHGFSDMNELIQIFSWLEADKKMECGGGTTLSPHGPSGWSIPEPPTRYVARHAPQDTIGTHSVPPPRMKTRPPPPAATRPAPQVYQHAAPVPAPVPSPSPFVNTFPPPPPAPVPSRAPVTITPAPAAAPSPSPAPAPVPSTAAWGRPPTNALDTAQPTTSQSETGWRAKTGWASTVSNAIPSATASANATSNVASSIPQVTQQPPEFDADSVRSSRVDGSVLNSTMDQSFQRELAGAEQPEEDPSDDEDAAAVGAAIDASIGANGNALKENSDLTRENVAAADSRAESVEKQKSVGKGELSRSLGGESCETSSIDSSMYRSIEREMKSSEDDDQSSAHSKSGARISAGVVEKRAPEPSFSSSSSASSASSHSFSPEKGALRAQGIDVES